eukprot:1097618_1
MSVRVAVRFRPVINNNNEQEQKPQPEDEIEQNLLIYPQLNCVNIARHFNLYFHDVLPLYSTQDEVFNIVQPLVDDFLQGNNISIITYGPSGCGKTYTMFGNGGIQTNPENVYRLGLMPRVISYIFDQLQQRFNPMNGEFIYQLQCTFLEIYNKKMIDLLNPYHQHKHNKQHKPKKVKFIQKQTGTYDHQNVTKVTISSIADVLRYMYQAFHNRKYVRKYHDNRTKFKYEQSKSHCVATLKLIFKKKTTNDLYKVSMVFIDCGAYCKSVANVVASAGQSHRPKYSTQTLEDSQYINRAFLCLGNVVTALHRASQGQQGENEGDIPWKDNNLTQTLHSLCTANTPSKVLLFLNCSLKSQLYEETLATLRFGNLAMTDPMLLNVMDNYRKKIKSLNVKIVKYKRNRQELNEDNPGANSSFRSASGSSSDDEVVEMLKIEVGKLHKQIRDKDGEINALHTSNADHTHKLDSYYGRIAGMEVAEIELHNELLSAQSNEQLLRDENEELQQQLDEMKETKQNTLQFIDTKLMKRASMIHTTNAKDKEMIDELSTQIESLERLKAELQYQIQQKTQQMDAMSKQREMDKAEMMKQQQEILKFKTNYILSSKSEIEVNQLMEQIRERDTRILEYERDIRENILNDGSKWKEQEQVYESTIKQLQQQLKESKIIIQQQHERGASNPKNHHINRMKLPMNNSNHEQQQPMNNSNQNVDKNSAQKIRDLKLEIARIKSAEYKEEKIAKLKKKNNALEERLINARSEKAKMLPALLREKTELKSELIEMKTTLALYLVKWKFIEKKYQKQIRDCRADLARYQRKLDTQIKGKRKMGNQMEMLDKLAQNTVKTAIHQRVISRIHTENEDDNAHNLSNSMILQTVTDEEAHGAEDTTLSYMPENLRRVQNVIRDLTTKLQKKHERINELEKKMALYQFSMSRTSNLGGRVSGTYAGLLPTSPPVITPSHTTSKDMFATFTASTTDLQSNSLHAQKESMTQISMTDPHGHGPPVPGDFAADDNKEDMAMFESQEQYLKAFLTKQHPGALAPTPEKSLPLGFFINKKKNIRISIDVSMTFYDVLEELSVHQPSDPNDLELQIEQNPDPIYPNIVVKHDMFHKTFWDLILEFGLFSLLKFNVITNAAEQRERDMMQVKPKKNKKSSMFKRFKSKKHVPK